MELVAIELILWLGFGLLLWALKDSLHQIKSDVNDHRFPMPSQPRVRYDRIAKPQQLIDPMGRYLDQQIYRFAVINGHYYQFDHICPKEFAVRLGDTQRWVAPRLVYEKALPATTTSSQRLSG